jgi:signal peptidase I
VLKIFKPALFVLVAAISLAVITTLSLYAAGAFPYRVYLIHTGSMGKTIPSGSLVVVREHQYHVGQVVTFVENDATVTHRLIAINADGIITTKGDANPDISRVGIPVGVHFHDLAGACFTSSAGDYRRPAVVAC